jgi:hypothetical protein
LRFTDYELALYSCRRINQFDARQALKLQPVPVFVAACRACVHAFHSSEKFMIQQQYRSCLEACEACAAACDHCADSCLKESDPKALVRCIALDIDCAAICRVAAGCMARASELSEVICHACAQACDACADECAKHDMSHCRECAQACRRCADECRTMMAAMVPRQQPSGIGMAG